jgi:hypothetical protein
MMNEGMGTPPCATVRIKAPVTDENPAGFVVINESEFDKGKHELFVEAPVAATEKKSRKASSSAAE